MVSSRSSIWTLRGIGNRMDRNRGYCKFAYSALACPQTGTSESASFQTSNLLLRWWIYLRRPSRRFGIGVKNRIELYEARRNDKLRIERKYKGPIDSDVISY